MKTPFLFSKTPLKNIAKQKKKMLKLSLNIFKTKTIFLYSKYNKYLFF